MDISPADATSWQAEVGGIMFNNSGQETYRIDPVIGKLSNID